MEYEYGIVNGHFWKCTFSIVLHLPLYNLRTTSRMEKRKHRRYQQGFGKRMMYKTGFEYFAVNGRFMHRRSQITNGFNFCGAKRPMKIKTHEK